MLRLFSLTHLGHVVSRKQFTHRFVSFNRKMSTNPLITPSTLQYQAPQFDEIKFEHYEPAFVEGMSEHLREIEAITKSAEAATFKNTVEALELSGRLFKHASMIFFNLCAANTNSEMEKLEQTYVPKFASHSDSIHLNKELFDRIKAVYNARDSLSGEQARLVEHIYKEFLHAGANLNDEKKAELQKINQQLAGLQAIFGTRLRATFRAGALVVGTEEELDGLTPDELAIARADAEALGHAGAYAIILVNTVQQPYFASLKNRETRRRLYEASLSRAEKGDDHDTRATLSEMARLRLRKANLLGKKCFAEWQLENQMATPASAQKLLRDIAKPAMAKAAEEAANMQALIDAQNGGFKLAAWDWAHYAEQVRKEKFDLDGQTLKPYFEFHNVLEKGVFYAAEKLYGVTLKRRTDLPVYDEDIMTFELFDADGTSIALFYLDPYARASKKGGAWMTNYVEQAKVLNQKPVVFNVLNLVKPQEGKPTLLSLRNITTLFHEFGHGLHGMLSDVDYPSLSGTAVSRDFVELPSQVNEKWAMFDPVLRNYAIHYQTQEPIPQALVDKMVAAEKYGSGFDTLEVTKAAILDMYWHTVTDEKDFLSVPEMEAAAMKAFDVDMQLVPPRYISSLFAHIFAGGYASGYYSYQWAKLLDCDAFEWFVENGGLTRKNGDHFRTTVLSKGNTHDPNEIYMNFADRMPDVKPFFRSRGFPIE